jgi:hypothetical protein
MRAPAIHLSLEEFRDSSSARADGDDVRMEVKLVCEVSEELDQQLSNGLVVVSADDLALLELSLLRDIKEISVAVAVLHWMLLPALWQDRGAVVHWLSVRFPVWWQCLEIGKKIWGSHLREVGWGGGAGR